MGLLDWTKEKLNPAQPILSNQGTVESTSQTPYYSYQQCYELLEVVNRGVNMLVDDVAAIPFAIGEPLKNLSSTSGTRKKTLDKLLNVEPNPYQDIDSFKRALILDLILDGNIFVYYDGAHLYHLPAVRMTVVSDKAQFVKEYKFDGGAVTYSPDEIIHIKDNSYKSIYRGSSRLEPALRTMRLILEMRNFQDNFFKNGAVPGLVLKTSDVLNQRLKDRLLAEWSSKYRPGSGGKRPVILDGGLEIDAINKVNFKELDFQNAIENCENTVLKCLGIPPLLFDSGNNANIRPNHRLYYLETIIPIVNKITAVFSKFFGFDVYEDLTYIEALRPELREQATYLQTLVNAGILTRNEARLDLGRPPMEGHDELIIPANVAGSAVNPNEGGAPSKDPQQ